MINDTIRLQHQQIRKALQELQEDVYDEEEVLKNQLWIALRIGTLSGIILMHLKYEDEYLYPRLLQHPKEKIRAISNKFIQEMGDLSGVFENYKDKYLKIPGTIKTNPAEFIKDTNAILYSISKRVEKEERELFPLLG
jgi:hemerythrin-like domain-containing protein